MMSLKPAGTPTKKRPRVDLLAAARLTNPHPIQETYQRSHMTDKAHPLTPMGTCASAAVHDYPSNDNIAYPPAIKPPCHAPFYHNPYNTRSANCNNHGNVNRCPTKTIRPTVLTNNLAKGEGVTTRRQAHQREPDTQRWRTSTSSGLTKDHNSTSSEDADKHPTASTSFRAVLAKRGLLISKTLGSGSYSKVKLAENIEGHAEGVLYPEKVAVKIIDRSKAPRDFQEKFLPRELEVWPQLSHPNIVSMLNMFSEKHRVYMVLEYCDGGDALRFIQNTGPVSELTARIWVSQLVDAVRYLHNMNITHRDLKLENLLIDKYNNIRLCDFGFVKPQCDQELSKTFCGSKSYAAPEILKGEPYDPKKADVWAVGVILFILVTGKMPFNETKGNSHLLEEHRALNMPWPRSRKAVSEQCKALTLYCLEFMWQSRPSIHHVLSQQWFINK